MTAQSPSTQRAVAAGAVHSVSASASSTTPEQSLSTPSQKSGSAGLMSRRESSQSMSSPIGSRFV